jgi:hypothetical protein
LYGIFFASKVQWWILGTSWQLGERSRAVQTIRPVLSMAKLESGAKTESTLRNFMLAILPGAIGLTCSCTPYIRNASEALRDNWY